MVGTLMQGNILILRMDLLFAMPMILKSCVELIKMQKDITMQQLIFSKLV